MFQPHFNLLKGCHTHHCNRNKFCIRILSRHWSKILLIVSNLVTEYNADKCCLNYYTIVLKRHCDQANIKKKTAFNWGLAWSLEDKFMKVTEQSKATNKKAVTGAVAESVHPYPQAYNR